MGVWVGGGGVERKTTVKSIRRDRKGETNRQTDRDRERNMDTLILMIYSFRPLPLMKGYRCKTYHLTVHTITIPNEQECVSHLETEDRDRDRDRERGVGGGENSAIHPKQNNLQALRYKKCEHTNDVYKKRKEKC